MASLKNWPVFTGSNWVHTWFFSLLLYFRSLDPAAPQRRPTSVHTKGLLHYLGITGLEEDALENHKEAMKWCRLTADQGYDNAQARQSQMDKYRENKT